MYFSGDVDVFVAMHKKDVFDIPMYCKRVEVNAEEKGEVWNGFIPDNLGDNISRKNYCYSELTAAYAAWKNSNSRIKGLCHYRRFFSGDNSVDLISMIKCGKRDLGRVCASEKEIIDIFNSDYDCIAVKPYLPFPKTVYGELKKYVYKKDIYILKDVIKEKCPEYLESFYKVLSGKNCPYFNMIIAKGEVFDRYCSWLFDILQETESRCNIENYDMQHKRLYGYFGEVLLGVYLYHNKLKTCFLKAIFVNDAGNWVDRIKNKLFFIRYKLHSALNKRAIYKVVLLFYMLFHKRIYYSYRNCFCNIFDEIDKKTII